MDATTPIIRCGEPPIRRSPVEIRDGRVGFDELRQRVTVYDQSDRSLAIAAANVAMHAAHTQYANFYVSDRSAIPMENWDGWDFDVIYLGTTDITRRHRVTTTLQDNISWEKEESNDLKVRYEALIPLMTLVDSYFSTSEPNWSQQGNAIAPVNAPTPPSLPTFSSDDVIKHIPFGWVLTNREADEVGTSPNKLWAVTDTISYFEETKPASF